MASTTPCATSVHTSSSRFVTVTKCEARNTDSMPGTAKSRAASGDTSAPTGCRKFAVIPGATISFESTHLKLCGFGVRSACMRKSRSMSAESSGRSEHLRLEARQVADEEALLTGDRVLARPVVAPGCEHAARTEG